MREAFNQRLLARENRETLVGEPKIDVGTLHSRDDLELDSLGFTWCLQCFVRRYVAGERPFAREGIR